MDPQSLLRALVNQSARNRRQPTSMAQPYVPGFRQPASSEDLLEQYMPQERLQGYHPGSLQRGNGLFSRQVFGATTQPGVPVAEDDFQFAPGGSFDRLPDGRARINGGAYVRGQFQEDDFDFDRPVHMQPSNVSGARSVQPARPTQGPIQVAPGGGNMQGGLQVGGLLNQLSIKKRR